MIQTLTYLTNANLWHEYPDMPVTHILGCPSKILWATINYSRKGKKILDNTEHTWIFQNISPQFPIREKNPETMPYLLLAHEDGTALITDAYIAKHISTKETALTINNNKPWDKNHVQNATLQAHKKLPDTKSQCAIYASTFMENLVATHGNTNEINQNIKYYKHNAIRTMCLAEKIWKTSKHTQRLMTYITGTFPKELICHALKNNLAISIPLPKGTKIPTMWHEEVTLTQLHATTLIPIEQQVYLIDNNGVCILDDIQLDKLLENISNRPPLDMGYLIHAIKSPCQSIEKTKNNDTTNR